VVANKALGAARRCARAARKNGAALSFEAAVAAWHPS
jgi:homoserine dehydrogenase